ncbi:hypothetical protein ACU6U9_09190 [Pseudomonas sp. HK3]
MTADIEGAWPELNDPSWVRGEDLALKLKAFDYQFVWAVISAFPKGTEPFTTGQPMLKEIQVFGKVSQISSSKTPILKLCVGIAV